ncbi:hypothetical protein PIB30_041250 [Stylosanthes scabra]|uniref:Uncharacterized protein n=1 Tax=Stylosanthes scabra TaxID=79078 RepID=A0ABU6UE37_9FABA|nr:hypothetical protein [Stylosanthes scabra]
MDRGACSKARAMRKSLINEKRFRSKTAFIENGQRTTTRRPLQEVNHTTNIGRTGLHLDANTNHNQPLTIASKENICKDHEKENFLFGTHSRSQIGSKRRTSFGEPLKNIDSNQSHSADKAKQARSERASKLAKKRHNRAAHVSNTGNTPISILDFNYTPSSTYQNQLSETTSPTNIPNYGSCNTPIPPNHDAYMIG